MDRKESGDDEKDVIPQPSNFPKNSENDNISVAKDYIEKMTDLRVKISKVYEDEENRKKKNKGRMYKVEGEVKKLREKIKGVKSQTSKTIEEIRRTERSQKLLDKYSTSRSIVGKAILYFIFLLFMIVAVKFIQNSGINLLEAYNYALGTPPPA